MRFPRVFSSAPSGSDHSLTVPSKLPEISRLPSGLMATRATQPVCASAPETQVAAWPRLGSTSAAAAAAAALNRLRRLSAQPDRLRLTSYTSGDSCSSGLAFCTSGPSGDGPFDFIVDLVRIREPVSSLLHREQYAARRLRTAHGGLHQSVAVRRRAGYLNRNLVQPGPARSQCRRSVIDRGGRPAHRDRDRSRQVQLTAAWRRGTRRHTRRAETVAPKGDPLTRLGGRKGSPGLEARLATIRIIQVGCDGIFSPEEKCRAVLLHRGAERGARYLPVGDHYLHRSRSHRRYHDVDLGRVDVGHICGLASHRHADLIERGRKLLVGSRGVPTVDFGGEIGPVDANVGTGRDGGLPSSRV